MFKSDYKNLKLSFNEFHKVIAKDMPEYDEFCLLELKDGIHTAGKWHPNDYKNKKGVSGHFTRGSFDSIEANEVAKWHSLERYDLSECLEDETINLINLGEKKEGNYSLVIKGFRSLKGKDFPKQEQYCLLIMNDGSLSAGRWDRLSDPEEGIFIYASALASHDMKEVFAWVALSNDDIFERELEKEREKQLEEELNKNPSLDKKKFKYGIDIEIYYEKALEKLKKEYPWATMTQMKKVLPYVIVPRHGKYIFGRDEGTLMDSRVIREWTDGETADEFIDYLCEYTKDPVINSNPEEKFRLGMDIETYLQIAFESVKKDYTWFDKKMIDDSWHYAIKKVDGEDEFVREYKEDGSYTVLDCSSAERFIENVEYDYQQAALRANPVVKTYEVRFGHIEIHGWNLEHYIFSRLKTGDYKVNVQAGDRVTGAGREFFITPYCFEAETFDEFLDRYLKIVPGNSFGLYKEDLITDEKLKKFLGY